MRPCDRRLLAPLKNLHVAKCSGLEAVAIRLEAIASKLEAIAIGLEAIAGKLEVTGWRPLLLEAIASRYLSRICSLIKVGTQHRGLRSAR